MESLVYLFVFDIAFTLWRGYTLSSHLITIKFLFKLLNMVKNIFFYFTNLEYVNFGLNKTNS